MASFMGNRGFGSGIFRPVLLVASICLLMFLLYAYSSTNSDLKQHKDRADRLTKQQEMLKTQVKDLLDARGKLEKDLQKMQVEQGRCIRDTEQLKKSYTSQIESMKETLKFRISSLENENSELQSRAGSYEEKYNELTAARKKDQDLFASAQQKCHETTQKLEAQNAELNVQMTDMQRNLDAFRVDRLRSESMKQNCSNQLALSKMKLDQLQEDFEQMATKLKVMGNAFNDKLPTVQKKSVPVDNGGNNSPSHVNKVHDDNPPDHRDDSLTKQDVLRMLQKKLANGEHLQDNERLLYQALTKEASEIPELPHSKQTQDRHNNPELFKKLPDLQQLPKLTQDHPNNPESYNKLPDFQQQPRQALDHKDTPDWFNNLPAEHRKSMSQETQDLLHKQGHNIPAPPFLSEYNANQQQQQKETLHFDDKHAGDDQKTFEQDQRDEERRLFEMFQGDNHGKNDDLKDDGDGKLTQDNELYGDDKDNGDEDDDDDYKEKDDNYVYGGQDRQVNPDTQDNNALI